jgi:hypothetical protein
MCVKALPEFSDASSSTNQSSWEHNKSKNFPSNSNNPIQPNP